MKQAFWGIITLNESEKLIMQPLNYARFCFMIMLLCATLSHATSSSQSQQQHIPIKPYQHARKALQQPEIARAPIFMVPGPILVNAPLAEQSKLILDTMHTLNYFLIPCHCCTQTFSSCHIANSIKYPGKAGNSWIKYTNAVLRCPLAFFLFFQQGQLSPAPTLLKQKLIQQHSCLVDGGLLSLGEVSLALSIIFLDIWSKHFPYWA